MQCSLQEPSSCCLLPKLLPLPAGAGHVTSICFHKVVLWWWMGSGSFLFHFSWLFLQCRKKLAPWSHQDMMVSLGSKRIFTNLVGQCEGYPWNVNGEAHTCYDLTKCSIKSIFRWCSRSGCSHLKKFAFQLRHHPGTTGNPTHWSRGSDPKWALESWHFWVMGGGWKDLGICQKGCHGPSRVRHGHFR